MKKLTCHCGEVEAAINIDGDLEKIVKCNCSICKRKAAIMSMVKNEDFKIIKGEDKLKLYQFHSKVAKHYFCSNCGIYTHHNPRSNPAMTGFNLGCVDEINTFDLKDIILIDGNNHPLDQKK
jgi:hypothetical protein|tara:strand:- start:60 stop:425 length:366 start_codon:yes stop_codon:yes gene_type:complete